MYVCILCWACMLADQHIRDITTIMNMLPLTCPNLLPLTCTNIPLHSSFQAIPAPAHKRREGIRLDYIAAHQRTRGKPSTLNPKPSTLNPKP